MNTRLLYFYIKYAVCDLIFDINSFCSWSCHTGKINVYDKIVIETRKKENMEIKVIFTSSKNGLGVEFTAWWGWLKMPDMQLHDRKILSRNVNTMKDRVIVPIESNQTIGVQW